MLMKEQNQRLPEQNLCPKLIPEYVLFKLLYSAFIIASVINSFPTLYISCTLFFLIKNLLKKFQKCKATLEVHLNIFSSQ